MSKQSIYTVGGTVQASDGIYISRDADEELLQLCRAGEFSYVLTARQLGKSSLMVATMGRLAAEGIRSVEIDLTQLGTGLTAEQWYLGVIDFIVDQLDLDVDYITWWDQRARLGPTQRLSQFLRQIVLEQVSEPVVVFIDEIDPTLNLDFTDDFFAALRACYNARASDPVFKRLSFVLLGVATPGDLISAPQRTPLNLGRRVDLADFTDREAVPLAVGLGLPPGEADQVLTWILNWTGGHPYLTQRLCAAVAASPKKSWDAVAVDQLVEKTFFGEHSAQDSNLQFVRDMLTQRAPDKVAVLKTYRRIHTGKAVPDEERSPVKTHLKLSGVVKRKEGNLVVRNRIYEQVFNQEWIDQNVSQDWAQRIAVVSTLLLLLLGGLFGYYTYRQEQQTAEVRAQAFIDNFRGTTSADVRITSLAGLFELGYEDRARQLFYEELGLEEQRALFEKADPQGVSTQLVTVVEGLYMGLGNNEQDNQLLRAMDVSLHAMDDPRAVNLATEIEQWVQGREAYAGGKYEQAMIAYSVAISLNEANPATHFERAIAYASLGRYEEALADFEETLRLDQKRALVVDKEIRSNGALYDALTASRAHYPELVAIVPTPTRTPTPTVTLTSTLTMTLIPTPTMTLTPTPVPTATLALQPGAVVSAEALHLRSGPGVVYDILGVLKRGELLEIAGKNLAGNWLKVIPLGKEEGWVAVPYLELNVSLSDVPVAQAPPTPTPTPTLTPPAPIELCFDARFQRIEDAGGTQEVRGYVYDVNGQPLKGSVVEIYAKGLVADSKQTLTADDGGFAFENLGGSANSEYIVRVIGIPDGPPAYNTRQETYTFKFNTDHDRAVVFIYQIPFRADLCHPPTEVQ